jgi:hypothetical protein
VFDLDEESGALEGVGMPDVGQVHGPTLSPDFRDSILIYVYVADLLAVSTSRKTLL